jgi:hypothetical protein
MSTRAHNLSRREMPRRRVLAGIAVLLMGASLVFTSSASAHNIDVAKAREIARDYARQVRDESGGKYLHYGTTCTRNFPNHNHSARCTINYYNAKDKAAGVYTCRETIEIFLSPHGDSLPDYRISGRHTSNSNCGGRRLNPNLTLG